MYICHWCKRSSLLRKTGLPRPGELSYNTGSINKSHTHLAKSLTEWFPNVPDNAHPILINISYYHISMKLKTLKNSLKLEIWPVLKYRFTVDLKRFTFDSALTMYKCDNKTFTGFMVYKIYSCIVSFSEWSWELYSYPILFLPSHASYFDQGPFSKLTKEVCSSSNLSLQFSHHLHHLRFFSQYVFAVLLFKFLVVTSALMDPTAVV